MYSPIDSTGFPLHQQNRQIITPTHNTYRLTDIIQVNMCQLAPPVKNWRILLVQSFTACMSLLTATSAFGLWRRCWSYPQQCYLHCLHAINYVRCYVHMTTNLLYIDSLSQPVTEMQQQIYYDSYNLRLL